MASSTSLYQKLQKHEEKNKPGKFTYNSKKPTYSFKEQKPTYNYDDSKMKQYYDKLLNRKDFSFDINGNALFNQYKDFYQKQGKLAMMDTIGQASAYTGGYGNSYATSAGQQAYQQNLDKLNEVVPELYQMALQQYQMEGDNLQNIYGILADDRDFAYNKYLGDVSAWQSDRDFAYQKYRGDTEDYYTDKNFAYGQYRDKVSDYQADRDYLYGQYADQRDYEHTLERDKVSDRQWQQEYNMRVKEFSESVRQFNLQYDLSEKEFDEMCRQFAAEYDLDVKQFEEDVRQYNENLSLNKQQYDLDVKQFEEGVRQYNETTDFNKQQADIGDIVNNTEQYGFGGWKGSGSNGEWNDVDDSTVTKIIGEMDKAGVIAKGDAAIRSYLDELIEDGAISLAQHKAIKATLGMS